MPIQDLLAFRERTVDGRRALAEAVVRCAVEVSAIEDPQPAKYRLDDAAAESERSREAIAKQSAFRADDLSTSVVCAGLPTNLTALPALAAANRGSVFDPLPLASDATTALPRLPRSARSEAATSPNPLQTQTEMLPHSAFEELLQPTIGLDEASTQSALECNPPP